MFRLSERHFHANGWIAYPHDPLAEFETSQRQPGDELIDPGDAQVVVFGMGRVGSAVNEFLHERFGDVVVGVDRDATLVDRHRQQGRR